MYLAKIFHEVREFYLNGGNFGLDDSHCEPCYYNPRTGGRCPVGVILGAHAETIQTYANTHNKKSLTLLTAEPVLAQIWESVYPDDYGKPVELFLSLTGLHDKYALEYKGEQARVGKLAFLMALDSLEDAYKHEQHLLSKEKHD